MLLQAKQEPRKSTLILFITLIFLLAYPLWHIGKRELFWNEGKYACIAADSMEFPPVMMPHEELLADCYRQMTELSERKSALSKRSKELDAQIKKLCVPFVEALNGADRGQFFYDGSSYEVAYARGERVGIPKKKLTVLRNAYPDAYDAVVETTVTNQ